MYTHTHTQITHATKKSESAGRVLGASARRISTKVMLLYIIVEGVVL